MAFHFRLLLLNFIRFLKDPNNPDYSAVSSKQKLLNVGFYYLVISFVISGIILWYPVEIAEKFGLFDELKEKDLKMSMPVKIATGLIFAPLIEEGMFRLWLGFYRNENYFQWLYYVSAILFGLVHIFNYQLNDSHYAFIPFITITQTFGGLILGYIRITYGFWYGVLLHASFNGLAIARYLIFGHDF
jgi:membrane protease YdiL (CAAX protease family)